MKKVRIFFSIWAKSDEFVIQLGGRVQKMVSMLGQNFSIIIWHWDRIKKKIFTPAGWPNLGLGNGNFSPPLMVLLLQRICKYRRDRQSDKQDRQNARIAGQQSGEALPSTSFWRSDDRSNEFISRSDDRSSETVWRGDDRSSERHFLPMIAHLNQFGGEMIALLNGTFFR